MYLCKWCANEGVWNEGDKGGNDCQIRYSFWYGLKWRCLFTYLYRRDFLCDYRCILFIEKKNSENWKNEKIIITSDLSEYQNKYIWNENIGNEV